MPDKKPKTAVCPDRSLSIIQSAQAAVERGEATVAEFDKLIAHGWVAAASGHYRSR